MVVAAATEGHAEPCPLRNFDLAPALQRPLFVAVAMPWALAGWPVIPVKVTKGRATPKGTAPSSNPDKVRHWGEHYPQANVGVVLSETRTVVFDVDGPEGEASLSRLLTAAGEVLPPTYTETTGKDYGRHLWLRLPREVQPLLNQYQSHHPTTPGLDVLSNGHVVAAGSVHQTGRRYEAQAPTPGWADLAEMPPALYEALAQRGRPSHPAGKRIRPHPRQRIELAPPRSLAAPGQPIGRLAPRWVHRLLADTSDGRDARAFKAVATLVRRCWADDEIIALLLGSVLGDKAREERSTNPAAWVQHKIDWVRQTEQEHTFDRDGYWVAAHISGMSSAEMRVLDCLLGCASPFGGTVSMSMAKIGIGSACSKPDGHIDSLLQHGWLRIIADADPAIPTSRVYRLSLPASVTPDDQELPALTPPLPLSPCVKELSGSFLVTLPGHDAFRRAEGSLNAAYPVLTLLGDTPVTMNTLAARLRTQPRGVRRHIGTLVRHDIAVRQGDGYVLAGQDLPARLDAVAECVGTAGTRRRTHEAYLASCRERGERSQQWLRDRATPGSDVWLKSTRDGYSALIAQPEGAALVDAWGWSDGDLVERLLQAELCHLVRMTEETVFGPNHLRETRTAVAFDVGANAYDSEGSTVVSAVALPSHPSIADDPQMAAPSQRSCNQL